MDFHMSIESTCERDMYTKQDFIDICRPESLCHMYRDHLNLYMFKLTCIENAIIYIHSRKFKAQRDNQTKAQQENWAY